MSNQSIINPDNSKSYLKGAIDVTKLKVNNEPNLLQTMFVGKSNKYDRNLAMAANDPMGQRTREQNRLINQPTSDAFYNAGIQAASEIGLGTLEGAGFLLDIPQWVNTIKGTERDFGNWFSDSIGELKKEVAEDNPIYAVEGYHPTNAKWWASMIPSIATSASLMIPSMGGAKLMSTVGKLSSKLAKGIASNTKSANLLAKGLEKAGAGIQNYTGVSAAVFSRMAEGTLEATEAGTQAYQKYMEQGMSMEEATEKAGQASAATFLGNMPLLALDLLQYNSIFKQFGSKVGIQAAENALDLSTKSLARRTLQKAWKSVKVPITEGAEEGLQFGVKEESIKMAEDGMPENRIETLMKQYSDIAKNVLPEYFNNDEFLTSITLGAVGGKVFDVITPAVRRLAKMDNTVDEDLRSGKIVAPYYKTRKAFVDLLQQDEVKATEMLEAAKTDSKLKLGEAESFQNLLNTYNDLKVDPLITKNPNGDLILKERMNEEIYSDLKTQLEAKTPSITRTEGIDDIDIKIDALTQLESYEMQTPSKNLRNIQEIRKRKAAYIAEKLESGVKTIYKPKEGYSWGSVSHRKAINHFANIELADIMASISRSKVIAYESENGSMYAGMDRKIQERLEKIEDLEVLRGSEDFDTDDKYINFLLEVQNDRPDLTDEISLILDNLYKENIYDETHPINTLANNSIYKDEAKKTTNQLFPIYEANKASALLTREDPSKLRFKNLFSNGISSNQLVTGDKLKYNITPTTGTLVNFEGSEYVLYKVDGTTGFFMSLKDSFDTFKLELSKIKPTDITTTFRKVKDPETNELLIILPDRAIVVGEGTVAYDRTNIENIVKHDTLAELSNPEVYKIENDRRKELEKADIKIPAIKTIGSAVNLTPFTLGNKNKASRKEAARKLGLKERELVKLSYYEEGSATIHSIPFMLVNGELLDTSNQFYDPEFDKRVFVKAQKYESQVDINNKLYNEINDRYNNKYLELMNDGTLTVTQVKELIKDKKVKPDLYKKINELAELKFRIRSPEDVAKILEIISNKGIDIRKRNQPSKVDGSIIENGNYEIDGKLFRSTTSLKESISNSKYPESAPKEKYTKPGNTIDSLQREIFGTTDLNRTGLVKKYKDLFSDETVLNDAITVIHKRKLSLEKEGFTFISEGTILFSTQTKKNIAGETDLIAYDRLGNIHIMDAKTFDESTYKKYKEEKTGESLSKRDGYRVQLSAYADMFEDRTGFKVSEIRVMPYVLERSDDGIITGIKTDLPESRINSMKVISDINPLEYRGINNSAFEVLEVTNKTEGIITPKNINRIFKAKIDHFKKEVLESNVDKQFTVTDFVAYYKDIIEFYNEKKALLKEIKESDIKELATLYSNIQTARGLEGVSDIVITGKQITNNLKTEINNKQQVIFLSKINKGFFTILDNKIYYLNNNYLRYKSAKDVDYENDFYVIKSGDSYYKANEESYSKLGKVYEDLINDNVSAEELVIAQELGFEKINDEDFIPSEMYGGYSIKELADNSLRIVFSNLDDVADAKQNNLSVEAVTIAKAVDNNIKELTLSAINKKVEQIEDKIEKLKSLEGESLSIENLQAYFIDENEAKLLDNAEKLKEFYEERLNYFIGQKDYYEQMFNNETESIPKEEIIQKLNVINREIGILEQLINALLELISKALDVITNTERLGRNKATLKEKQNIKNYIQELLDSEIFTNVQQPEITDTDIQDLKDLGVVKKGTKRDITNLKTKGSFRKLKNKYIGSIVYVSPGVNINKFINDIGSEDIIYLDYSRYSIPEVEQILKTKDPNKILIISNPKLYSIVDNFILLADPTSDTDVNNANAHILENKVIYDRLLNDEDFVRKVEFINYGDDLTNFMTEGITPLSDEEINEADSKYTFQYSGLIDNDITYNPYKDSTLVVRGDYFNAEAVDSAIYGSFYPRIATDDDGLNNIIDDLMYRGVVTLDGETLGTNYNRSQFEDLYTNKSKKDLFKKSATILLHKSEKGNLNIVLAYKDTSQDIPQYIPVGLMNTLEQSIYAYTTENDDVKPRAVRNIMMSNFIRNEIESLANNVDLSSGKLVEIEYDRVKFLDARTTGLNVTKTYDAVSERINSKTQRPTVYVINKKEIIAQKNLTNEEEAILNEYNTDVYKDKFRVFYKTSDKLGKTIILPATLKKYSEAPQTYKDELKNKITELLEVANGSSIVEDTYLNESKLKEIIDEILNNYTNFTYNNPSDFVNGIKSYDDFVNKYNINDKNMVINFEDLTSKRDYREKLMSDYLVTNVDRDPYVNVQYIFGTTPYKPITGDFDEAIQKEPLIAEGLFYEESDKVKTNRFLILDDDVKKSIKKPLNYETYYRDETNGVPQFVGEITNKFKDKNDISYTESFNEFVRSLNSIDDLDKYNVIEYILRTTNNSTIKNLRKEYLSDAEFINDAITNSEKDFSALYNHIEKLKTEINTNNKLIRDFYNKVDNAYFLDNETELDPVILNDASRALLSLAIQKKKLDFADPNKLISIIKGSTESNFFLNELVLLLLEKTNAANLTTVVKLVKSLRPDIQTIELTDENEFVLVKNTKVKPDSGKLYSTILKGLKSYGYNVDIENESYSHDDSEDISVVEEEKDSKEAWSIVKTFQFPTTTLSKNTKILLQSIISEEKDTLGLGINLNYKLNTAYAMTVDKLVNSKSAEDLRDNMSFYSKSIEYIKRLKEYIDNSENPDELYGQLYVAIGNKIRVTYKTVIKDKNQSIYPVLSNRQSAENIISTMLNAGIKSNNEYKYKDIIDALMLSNKEKIDLSKIKEFETILTQILLRYDSNLKIYNSLNDNEFYKKYQYGKNTYTFDTRDTGLDGENYRRVTTKKLIRELVKYIPKSSNAVHMTVEKTMQYQDTTGNFIGYVQNNTEEHFNKLRKDPLFKKLPVLNRDDNFEVIQVIGYDDQYNDKGTTIGKLDKKLAAEMLLSMHKENSYPVPVPGDSGNMVYVNNVVPISKNIDIDKELYSLMLFEKDRIESIGSRDRDVKSYRNNGSEYVIFKAIDKILKEEKLEFNEFNVKKAFDKYFEESSKKFIDYLKSLGIVDNEGLLQSKIQGYAKPFKKQDVNLTSKQRKELNDKNKADSIIHTKNEITNFLKRFTASYVNITLLTINDPSYYPRIEEVFKRAKQNISPGIDMDMTASYTNRNNTADKVILRENTPMRITILNDVDDFFTKDPQYDEIKQALLSIRKENVILQYDGTSETDGQAYIDPIAYRQRMVGLREWTDADQLIMDELMIGNSIVGYNIANNKVSTDSKFTTIKPFYFYNGSGIGREDNKSFYSEPIQIKDSEMLITPYYGLKKLINDNNEFIDNPNYNAFYRNILQRKFGYEFNDTNHTVKYVENKRISDLVVFNSAVKVGLPISDKTEDPSTDITDDSDNIYAPVDSNMKGHTITVPFRFWKKQNETPKGHFSKESIYGTQLMKLIMADIPDGATFNIDGETLTKEQIVTMYNDILVTDVNVSLKELKEKYGDDKDFNVEKFVKVLQEEMQDDTINMQKALEYTFDENGNVLTNLPLAHPFVTNRIQPKTNAIFKNNVTVRKFVKGFKAANASSYGFQNKPKIVWNLDKNGIESPSLGINHFEIIAPIHDKKIYEFVDKASGVVNMDALRNTYPELLEGLLYRIPTEDKYSMFKVKIIGFLPNEDGAIIMPSMVTTLSGMDFDIDKMFGFFKSTELKYEDYINDVYFKSKNKAKNQLINNIVSQYGDNKNNYPEEILKEYNSIVDKYNNEYTNVLREGSAAYNTAIIAYNMYNSSLKSDNNKLDIMRAVLSHPTTLKSQLIPGGFKVIEEEVLNMRYYDMLDENLKFIDKEVTETIFTNKTDSAKKSILNVNARTFIDPSLWIDTVMAMNVGKDMTGIAANHNAARAIIQQSGIKLLDILTTKHAGKLENPKVDLSNIYDFDNETTIVRAFSTILSAVVDNGKNPLISYFGLNPSNANIAMAALHLGYPLKDVIYFNKAFTNMLSNSLLSKEQKKAIAADVDKGNNVTIDIDMNSIIKYIKNRKNIETNGVKVGAELIEIEKIIYRNYYILEQLGKEFNDIVTYIQRGNRGGKPTFFENYIDIVNYNNYIKEPEVKYFDKQSIKDHFDNKSMFTTRFNMFINEQNDIVNKLLSLPGFFKSDLKELTSFRTLIESRNFIKKIDDKILSKLYNALYYKATVESQSEYFDIRDKQLETLTKDKFLELKRKYADNAFINSLQLDKNYIGEGIKLQVLSVDFKDKDQQDRITQDWRNLLQSNNDDAKFIGELLAVYSLRTTGFDTTRDSFNHLIPVEFYTDILKNYTKLLNNKIVELVNNPATGINVLNMILNKYNFPKNTFNESNVSIDRQDNTKEVTLLGKRSGNIEVSPLYYNTFSNNINDYNNVIVLDESKAFEEEDVNELGSELNPEIKPQINLTRIISGGQSGADMGGLDAAIELGIPTGGTAAAGFQQETNEGSKIKNTELNTKYGLKEGAITKREGAYGTYDDVYYQRTIDNAQEADGTIWFGNPNSPGGILTLKDTTQQGKVKPLINPTNAEEIRKWIIDNNIKVLNVAGNREKSKPGIYNTTKTMLVEALTPVKQDKKPIVTIEITPSQKEQIDNLRSIDSEYLKYSDEQIQEFINNIFPNSKIKDVFYHWSVGSQISEKYGDDLGRVKGIWLSKDSEQWKDVIKNKSKRLGVNEIKKHILVINATNVWVDSRLKSPEGSNFPKGYDTITSYDEADISYSGDMKSEFKTVESFESVIKDKSQIFTLNSDEAHKQIENFIKNKSSNKKDTNKPKDSLADLKGLQLTAAKKIISQFDSKKSESLLLLGRAGTGKTYMLASALEHIVNNLQPGQKLNIVGSALANSAKNQLAESLSAKKLKVENVEINYHSVASLLNSVKTSFGRQQSAKDSKIVRYRKERTILIVDEMSMLSEKDFERIETDADSNVLVIYAGDHGQLPPISKPFELKSKIKPENILHLTTPQRQKKGSPILDYLDPIWEHATEQPKPADYIAIPNVLTSSGGIATINLNDSIDNIAKLYKKAVAEKNVNYVQYISYANNDVDNFNAKIREKIFGEKVEDFVENDFVMFYDGYEVTDINEKTGEPLIIDNGTRGVIVKVKEDYTLNLTDLNNKSISFKGKTYTVRYKYNNINMESDINILNLSEKIRYDKFKAAMIRLDKTNISPLKAEDYKNYDNDYLKYNFGRFDSQDKVEKTKYFELADKLSRIADLKHGYAITVHKSQGMTTDVAIYNRDKTNDVLDFINKNKTSVKDKKDGLLLRDKTHYTASSRAKHLMLIVEGKGSDINEQGSFVDIVDRIKNETQERVELTVSDKKSSTTSTKESEVEVKRTIQKTVFSPLYITKTGSKKENGKYKLKDSKGTIVELSSFLSGISYDRFKKQYTVGSIKYTEEGLAKALGYKKLTNELKQKIYKKDKSLNVYLLKKYTPPKKSTKPPTTSKPPKDEKPKEVKIDMTKQFEMYGNKFIPYSEGVDLIYAINTKDNSNVSIRKSDYKPKKTDISIEINEPDDFGTIRIKSNDIIYVIQDDGKVTVYTNTLNHRLKYNKLNKDYFTCQ